MIEAKDFVSVHSPFRHRNDLSCFNNIYQTPIVLRNNPEKCSMNCALDFLYPEMTRHLSVEQRLIGDEQKPMVVLNVYSEDIERNKADIVFNNEKYFLRRIEIYHRSLHRLNVKNCSEDDPNDSCHQDSETQPMEFVFYHQSFLSETQIVAISVFAYPMISYALSQDIFSKFTEAFQGLTEQMQQDINNSNKKALFQEIKNATVEHTQLVSAKTIDSYAFDFFKTNKVENDAISTFFANDFYLRGLLEFPEYFPEQIDQNDISNKQFIYKDEIMRNFSKKVAFLQYTDENRQYYQQSTTSTDIDDSVTLLIPKVYRKLFLEPTWNPINMLPNRKSFFTYQGSFPGSNCHSYMSTNKSKSNITWIIMENSMPIHEDDYNFLTSFLRIFPGNCGEKYPLYPLNSQYIDPEIVHRKVYYNDGFYVKGNNRETDRFTIKCTKREQKPTFSKMYFDTSSSASSSVSTISTSRKELSEYREDRVLYDPDQNNTLLMVLLWLFFIIVLLGILYYMMSLTKNRLPMVSFCVICLVIYYLSNWRKLLLLLNASISALLMIVWYFLLQWILNAQDRNKYLFLFLKGFVLFMLVASIFSILLSCGSLFDHFERKCSFIHISSTTNNNNNNNTTYYISKFASIIQVYIGTQQIEYGLDQMQKIDFRDFKLEPKQDIVKYENQPHLFYSDILNEYNYQMQNSTHTPWESFQRAVMKYAEFGKKYYYKDGPEQGLRLNFQNISEILRRELPQVSNYLLQIM